MSRQREREFRASSPRQSAPPSDKPQSWTSTSLSKSIGSLLSAGLVLTQPSLALASALFPPPVSPSVPVSLPALSSSLSAPSTSFRLPERFPPLPDIKPTPHESFVLSNGLKVYLMKDTEVPLVRGSLLIRGGVRGDPEGMRGLASFTSSLLRLGGSTAHPQIDPQGSLDTALEDLAASIEGGTGPDALSLGFTCLREDTKTVLSLFTELITSPALPPDKLEFIRTQAVNNFMHRNDSVGPIPRREAVKLTYGPDSIYSRQTTLQSLQSISVADVRGYLDTWVRPDNAVLGIAGDFSVPEMKALLEASLGTQWKIKESQPPTPPSIPSSSVPTAQAPKDVLRRAIYVIDKPGSQSSNAVVVMQDIGVRLSDPDLFALEVLNRTLNGFGGKLFEDVRSKNGLAYSVQGAFEAGIDHEGLFTISGDTNDPAAFVRRVESVLADLTKSPLPKSAIDEAKQRSENEFVFNFSSTSAQLGRLISYELLGIPSDFLYEFKKGIERVDQQDAFKAAQKHVRPDQLITVVGGDLSQFLPGLQELAKERGTFVIKLDVMKEPVDFQVLDSSYRVQRLP